MPEQGSVIVKWDRWDGGDVGQRALQYAAPNEYRAFNMLLTSRGSLCVRPGLRDITPTGMPSGPLLCFAYIPVVGHDGVFMIAEHVWTYSVNQPSVAPTNIGAFDHAPNQPIVPAVDTATLVAANISGGSAPGTPDKVYRIDPAAGTVAGISGSAGGDVVALYGLQIVVGKSEFSPQIEGSSPTNPTDWSGGIFADIGDNWQVTALTALRNGLAILKRTGLYVLTGVFGDLVTQTIRHMIGTDGPLHPWQAAKDDKERIWFLPWSKSAPAMFDGSSYTYFGDHTFGWRAVDNTLADTPLVRGVAVVDNNKASEQTVVFTQGTVEAGAITGSATWARHMGAWFPLDFGNHASGFMTANGNELLLTDGGTNVTPARIYSWVPDLDRPGATDDILADATDGGSGTPINGEVTREYWSPDGRDIEVRQIVVDFAVYPTGLTDPAQFNHFDIDLTVLGRTNAEDAFYTTRGTGDGPSPLPFDEDPDAAWGGGRRRLRRVFNWNAPSGAGFRVHLLNIRGIEIFDIEVLEAPRKQNPIA